MTGGKKRKKKITLQIHKLGILLYSEANQCNWMDWKALLQFGDMRPEVSLAPPADALTQQKIVSSTSAHQLFPIQSIAFGRFVQEANLLFYCNSKPTPSADKMQSEQILYLLSQGPFSQTSKQQQKKKFVFIELGLKSQSWKCTEWSNPPAPPKTRQPNESSPRLLI